MNKDAVIQIRLTTEQKTFIQERAKKNGKKVSQFLLDLALQGANLETLPSIGDQKAQAEEEAAEIVGDLMTPIDFNVNPIPPTPAGPTPEEVDAVALEIHNTEGEPMRAAMAIALARLSE